MGNSIAYKIFDVLFITHVFKNNSQSRKLSVELFNYFKIENFLFILALSLLMLLGANKQLLVLI